MKVLMKISTKFLEFKKVKVDFDIVDLCHQFVEFERRSLTELTLLDLFRKLGYQVRSADSSSVKSFVDIRHSLLEST